MTLPKRIQDMADEAKRLQEDLIAGRNTAEEKPPAPDTPEADAMRQDAAVVEDITPAKEHQAVTDEPEVETPDNPPPKTDPAERHEDGLETWKARYKTLEGKYNAEVPRLSQEIRQLKDALRDYQAELTNRANAQADAAQRAERPEDAIAGDINPDAYEEYGDEFKDLASKLQWAIHQVKSLKGENEKLRDQVGGVYKNQNQQSYDAFLNQIRSEHPAFDQQDQDPEFLQWLDTMQINLPAIAESRDVQKALSVYRAWSDLTGRYKESSTPPVTSAHPGNQNTVTKQVAPPRSRPAAPQSGPKVWSRKDIAAFYEDVKSGKYSEQEALTIKHQIFDAQRKGLIT